MKISKQDIAIIVATVAIAAPVMFMPDLNSEQAHESLPESNSVVEEPSFRAELMWDLTDDAERKDICARYRKDPVQTLIDEVGHYLDVDLTENWELLLSQEC